MATLIPMAAPQGGVAVADVIAEIEGHTPEAKCNHEMTPVTDECGKDSIYLRQGLWDDDKADVRQGRFWSWAKRVHERYWQQQHSSSLESLRSGV